MRHFNWLFMALATAISGMTVTAAFATDAKPVQQTKVVRLTNGEWKPYFSADLPEYGYGSAIVTAAFQAVGMDVEYGFFPWKRSYRYTQTGTWHGSVGWVKTDERTRDFLYTEPFISDTDYVFSMKSNPVVWSRVGDLHGIKIALEYFTVYPPLDLPIAKNAVHASYIVKYESLLPMVLAGRTDATVLMTQQAEYFRRQGLLDMGEIYRDDTPLYERVLHLVLSKEIENGAELVDAFNRGLGIIKSNGTYDNIMRRLNSGEFDGPSKQQRP